MVVIGRIIVTPEQLDNTYRIGYMKGQSRLITNRKELEAIQSSHVRYVLIANPKFRHEIALPFTPESDQYIRKMAASISSKL